MLLQLHLACRILVPSVTAASLFGMTLPTFAQGVGIRPAASAPASDDPAAVATIATNRASEGGFGDRSALAAHGLAGPRSLATRTPWAGTGLFMAQSTVEPATAASGAATPGPAATPTQARPALTEQQLARRGALIVGGSAAALLTYGYLKWWDDGLTSRLKWANEGWFGRGTEYGGTDKLGHAYSNALGVRLLGAVLEEAGYPRARATRLAFWSTTAAYAAIELLDGVSRRYDASLQDMAFNLLGAAGSALLLSDPALDRLIDFRMSYSRSRFANGWDAFGDYEGQTYWLVAKAEGVPALASNPFTRYLEVSLGYGARNFDVPAGSGLRRERELRLAVGINLARVFGDAVAGTRVEGSRAHRVADLAFELVQHPLRVGTTWTD